MSGAGGATTCTEISRHAQAALAVMIVKTFMVVKAFSVIALISLHDHASYRFGVRYLLLVVREWCSLLGWESSEVALVNGSAGGEVMAGGEVGGTGVTGARSDD